MTTQEYVHGLRQLADWYEAHPETELPYASEKVMYIPDDRDGMRTILHIFGGRWEKEISGGLFYARRAFGPFTLTAIINQSQVCTARVVGTRVIPAIAERTVDVLEWDCAPILETAVMP